MFPNTQPKVTHNTNVSMEKPTFGSPVKKGTAPASGGTNVTPDAVAQAVKDAARR